MYQIQNSPISKQVKVQRLTLISQMIYQSRKNHKFSTQLLMRIRRQSAEELSILAGPKVWKLTEIASHSILLNQIPWIYILRLAIVTQVQSFQNVTRPSTISNVTWFFQITSFMKILLYMRLEPYNGPIMILKINQRMKEDFCKKIHKMILMNLGVTLQSFRMIGPPMHNRCS